MSVNENRTVHDFFRGERGFAGEAGAAGVSPEKLSDLEQRLSKVEKQLSYVAGAQVIETPGLPDGYEPPSASLG